jgi:hypothetical protein
MTRACRREVVDVYVEDGRAAVYSTEGMVLLLSELATAAWDVLGDDWTNTEHVAQHLVQRFGDPGEGQAEALTDETLGSLAEMSIVELEQS